MADPQLDFYYNDPGVKWAQANGAQLAQTVPQTQFQVQKSDPPAAPNTAYLQSIQNQVQRKTAINSALKDYDQLYASTKAQGFQSANNAGNVYANRLLQSGVNPLASGVVAAQSKLPIYSQLAQINEQKDQTRLDATNKADSLAAQIASQIANIQLGYTKTLADYNSQQTGFNLDLQRLQSTDNLSRLQMQQQDRQFNQQLQASQLAQSQTKRAGSQVQGQAITPGNTPGYIPDFSSITPGTGTFAGNGNSASVGWGF